MLFSTEKQIKLYTNNYLVTKTQEQRVLDGFCVTCSENYSKLFKLGDERINVFAAF